METYKAIPPIDMPDETVCVILEVPNSPQWLSAFWWVLNQYNYWFNWERTSDKRAKNVATRWRKMFWDARHDNYKGRKCSDIIFGSIGLDLGEDISMQIRISPDDSCIIQMWCIDHWEDWYDPRECIPGQIEQPTDGGGLAPGECREWDVSLRGNEKWLLPAVVSAGDTIEITGASGAWNDGTLGWNCVDGRAYFAGVCGTPEPPDGSDPLQTASHMRLIMEIDSVFYDAYNQLQAVPSGVTDEQVVFQANDSTLEGNSGAVSFHVKLCKAGELVETFSISYARGSGLTSAQAGQIFGLTSVYYETDFGPNYNVEFTVSPCCKIEVLGQGGWTSITSAVNVNWNTLDCASVGHPVFPADSTDIMEFGNREVTVCGINSLTPFTLTVRITSV